MTHPPPPHTPVDHHPPQHAREGRLGTRPLYYFEFYVVNELALNGFALKPLRGAKLPQGAQAAPASVTPPWYVPLRPPLASAATVPDVSSRR